MSCFHLWWQLTSLGYPCNRSLMELWEDPNLEKAWRSPSPAASLRPSGDRTPGPHCLPWDLKAAAGDLLACYSRIFQGHGGKSAIENALLPFYPKLERKWESDSLSSWWPRRRQLRVWAFIVMRTTTVCPFKQRGSSFPEGPGELCRSHSSPTPAPAPSPTSYSSFLHSSQKALLSGKTLNYQSSIPQYKF